MFGWKCRLGIIVPSSNTTVEPEFALMAPSGVSTFAARVFQRETERADEKIESVLAMREHIPVALDQLLSVGPHAIAYTCTAGSFLGGREDDRETCSHLSSQAGVPVITTSTAVLGALEALGVQRVALVTPYVSEVNEREKAYLEESGFEVTAIRGMGIVGNVPKGRLSRTQAYQEAIQVDVSNADAIFISCTNWRTVDLIPDLEANMSRPVVSSNQATFWALLRASGVHESVPNYGLLLANVRAHS